MKHNSFTDWVFSLRFQREQSLLELVCYIHDDKNGEMSGICCFSTENLLRVTLIRETVHNEGGHLLLGDLTVLCFSAVNGKPLLVYTQLE